MGMTFDEWFSSVFGAIQTHQAELFRDELEALWNLARANRKWVGLTQKDVDDLLSNMSLGCVDDDVRLVEARLREKNT
jgi:hypothetical protein